jgi:hypothetical protein
MVAVHNFQLPLQTVSVLASIPVLAQEREDSFRFWVGESLGLAWRAKLLDALRVYLGPSKRLVVQSLLHLLSSVEIL